VHDCRVGRRLRQLFASYSVELQHYAVLEDLLNVVGVGEAMLLTEDVFPDDDPIEYVLIFGGQDVGDLPDRLTVAAVHGGPVIQNQIRRGLTEIHDPEHIGRCARVELGPLGRLSWR